MSAPVYTYTNNNRSSSITAGATAQQLMPANANRTFWRLQNTSRNDLWFRDDGNTAAATSGSYRLRAGETYESTLRGVTPSSLSIYGPTTGQTYSAFETSAALVSGTPVAFNATLTDASGTITAGGSAQQILASNPNLAFLRIQNLSTSDLWINDTGSFANANAIGCYKLAPGASYESPNSGASNSAISIYGATTGQAFSVVYATALTALGLSITNWSGSITTGGTVQQLMPANLGRKGWRMQNISGIDLWINYMGGVAAANAPGSFRIPSGLGVEYDQGEATLTAINIYGDLTSLAFSAGEW